METKEPKKGKRNYLGKTVEKETVKRKLIAGDSPEEEPSESPHAELSNDVNIASSEKENANFSENSSAVVDVVRWDFILIKLAGKGAFLITQLK